jgi:D-alanyl-D-alanine endopeptidase (penicillin-binding protein 7)
MKKHLLLFALTASLLAAASSAGDAPLQLASLGQDSRDNHRTASSPWQALNPRKLQLKSATALVVDRFGNEVYAKQVDTPMPIASITKLMTAMVILDAGQPLQERITITREDRDRIRNTGSRLGYGTDADGLGKPRGQRTRPQLARRQGGICKGHEPEGLRTGHA